MTIRGLLDGMGRWLAAAALSAVLTVPVSGAPEPGPSGRQVQFNFVQADLHSVTKLVGAYTGKTFIVPESVTGKVTILTQGTIPEEEVYPLFLSMLEGSGYTVAERDGVHRVVPLPGGAPALPTGSGIGGGLVTKIIPVKNVNAAEVKRSFEPLVRGGKEGALEVFTPGNHLIITDTAGNIERLEALVAELDQPGAGSTVEVVELRHASAEEVAKQLRATFGATDSAVNKVHRHFQQVAGGTGSLPTDFTVVEAPEANSLILVGMPSQIAETRRIIEKMDVESPHGFGRLNAIFLKYLSAEDAAKSLNALLGKGTEAEPSRRSIAIEPSVPNNALLVDASSQDFEYVRRLVERLDVVPQQVLVEVLIAEVNLEEGLDLGVEWFGLDVPEGSGTGGFGRTRYGDSDSMMGLLTEGSFPQGLALGIISGTFTGPDGTEYNQIPMYLKAVARDRDLKILSNIPLWAQNNLEAAVSVVENIPILKSSVEGSGSDRDFIQNIERLDVGIKLKLTPQVNPDREIRLELNPSIESVVEESSEALRYTPTIAKREVKTTVTVPDRATVILSGLIREDTSQLRTKVPLLGDIPLLGALFRSTTTVKKRTNLLIFVTPRIVTDMQMAEKEKARLERAASLSGAAETLNEPSPTAEAAAQREAAEKARRVAKKKAKAKRAP
ncbi:MAG: type II secretion system secretin GspD [Kiritimatiellae bacterium]|nr:type II secretion system secretin GspD [Kiritimatiellia bacterium]MDY0150086.1 type II secretion system secretin GspD [Kiritimatiellia bacterium]